MLAKIFGVNNEVIESMVEVNEKQATVADLVALLQKSVEGIDVKLEMMEGRIVERINTMYEKFDHDLAEIKVKAISVSKEEVVKAIDNKSKENRKQQNIRIIQSKLDRAVAKYLAPGLPLVKETSMRKHPLMTPQGMKVYEAISAYIVGMAKVQVVNKEQYTNKGKYVEFFKQYGIKPYERVNVTKPDGKGMRTLLATIMLNGHTVQYLNYIQKVTKEGGETA